MKKTTLFLILLILLGCNTNKSIDTNTLDHEDQKVIEYLFSEYEDDMPGASVMVIKNGAIVHEENYGLANVETNQKTSSTTNYRIASVTKQFTAMAIMLLVEQGKLDYQTKLTAIFPEFPKFGDAITIRQLITHQSGLIDYYEFFDNEREEQASDAEVLENLIKTDSTYFVPGSKHQYSNSGYAILAQIVEKVSGLSFADFMDREVFQKLNMSTTQVFELDKEIPNRAYGYNKEENKAIFSDQSVSSAIQGDGGIYSSTMDYYKWDQALYTDKLLPKDKLADAFSNWDNNERKDNAGYGYGWYIDYENGIKLLNHSGGTTGFAHRVSRVPSLNQTVVIFSNHDDYDRNLLHMVNGLTSIYSNYKIPMPVDIMMKKEIDQQGVDHGIKVYDQLRHSDKYSSSETTLSYLGMEYYRTGKYNDAEALFRKAISASPNYYGGYYCMGVLNKKLGVKDEAIENFRKVMNLGTPGEEWMMERAKNHLEELLEK